MKKILTHVSLVLLFTSFVLSPSFALTLTVPSSPGTTETSKDTTAAVDREKVNEALKEFKSLSKHDRKERLKEAKKVVKKYKADKRAGKAEPSTNMVLLVILAILLPPVAVYLHEGEINTKFWISIILTLLFWIPGVIYALIVILS
jgi:uncharacterized membrane protein YqaE (UPF0057 family)